MQAHFFSQLIEKTSEHVITAGDWCMAITVIENNVTNGSAKF